MKCNKAFLLFCPPDCLDGENRPVLEGRSIQHRLKPSAYEECPYADSREKVINVESLKALSKNKDEVFAFIQNISTYLQNKELIDEGDSSLLAVYQLAYIGYKSPQIFFIKKIFDEEIDIPVPCAVASRFLHGLINTLSIMALDDKDADLQKRTFTAAEIHDYAASKGYLNGRYESCAASSSTILKYLKTIVDACLKKAPHDLPHQRSAEEIEEICYGARVINELEFCSLIYETVRCRTLRTQEFRNQEKALRDGPIPLFATTHCLIAKKISTFEKPFEHILFKRAYNLSKSLLINTQRVNLIQDLANQVLANASDFETSRKRRLKLKYEMRSLFESYAKFMEKHIDAGEFLAADLDVFFGKWPAYLADKVNE